MRRDHNGSPAEHPPSIGDKFKRVLLGWTADQRTSCTRNSVEPVAAALLRQTRFPRSPMAPST